MRITLITVLVLTLSISKHVRAHDGENHYIDEWAAEIPGGWDQARQVAKQHGYTVLQQIQGFDDFYVLHRSDVPQRTRRGAHHHTRKLVEDYRVRYVAQQQEQFRVKRSLVSRNHARSIVQEGGTLDDPELYQEWYLNPEDFGTSRRDTVRADLKVKDVWRRGITGKGIVVTILDDGLERTHPDLKDNYDATASFDFNDNDTDPSPRYDFTNENKHGTRCGGEIAMVANNNNCGVGIAFDSRIGGVRMLDGRITDRLEGGAIAFNRNHIDIYSASWGPNDDGRTVEGPGLMAAKAFELGIAKGRNGKGSLYVWASGNGGRIGDNCNADGYTSSIYTLSVSSATQFGNSPWYSEKCASTLTTTYSSGGTKEGKVTSADLHGQCTNAHTGTSAAAPMAAGVLALLLEANPNITWRDVQHIVAQTSRMEPLALEKGWYRNGAGHCVNLAFGFGLMDALAIVELANASTWTNVGEQHICAVESEDQNGQFPQKLNSGSIVEVEFKTDGCKGQVMEVGFLEHVQVLFTVDYPRRGNIYAELESPMGTITPLMLERKYDSSRYGFKDWPLMTVHNWGEKPQGTWKFRVADRSVGHLSGHVKGAALYLHGTKEQPEYQKSARSKYCGDVQTFADLYSDGSEHTQHFLEKLLKDLKVIDEYN